MKVKKEVLRQGARLALKTLGYDVQMATGPGIVPGARLRAIKDDNSALVAVRTSLDREVGLLRKPNGTWRTIPNVQLVLIAVPADNDPSVEVFAFDPNVLINVFNDAVAVKEKGNRSKARFKDPVFVSLDEAKKNQPHNLPTGLKAQAAWSKKIPLTHPELQMAPVVSPDPRADFIGHLKEEVAQFLGVDVSKVFLEIRIVA